MSDHKKVKMTVSFDVEMEHNPMFYPEGHTEEEMLKFDSEYLKDTIKNGNMATFGLEASSIRVTLGTKELSSEA